MVWQFCSVYTSRQDACYCLLCLYRTWDCFFLCVCAVLCLFWECQSTEGGEGQNEESIQDMYICVVPFYLESECCRFKQRGQLEGAEAPPNILVTYTIGIRGCCPEWKLWNLCVHSQSHALLSTRLPKKRSCLQPDYIDISQLYTKLHLLCRFLGHSTTPVVLHR